jgi:hypothetical protein
MPRGTTRDRRVGTELKLKEASSTAAYASAPLRRAPLRLRRLSVVTATKENQEHLTQVQTGNSVSLLTRLIMEVGWARSVRRSQTPPL